MRLLVSCIPYDRGKSGISAYVREVVRELCRQGHELTLLCEPARPEAAPYQVAPVGRGVLDPPPTIVHAPRWTRRPVLSMLWHLLFLPFWIRRHRREFDGFVICSANRRVCAWYPLPTVATVHDLANFHVPGKYSRMRMFYLAHILPFYAKRAQRLVAVSGATKADMVKYWKCRPEDVTVLYNGLAMGRHSTPDDRHPGDIRQSTTDEARQRNSAILYISRIEHPGKNHVRLIEAYGRLPRAVAEAHPLVIAGADWKDAEVVHEAAAKSPYANLIRFTGFVPAEDIESLWDEAGFYVFPSLFEGFGLSLIEAMARGIPCACSNNGSLGEIAGDVALTFDPESADDIAATLERLLGEGEAERGARVKRGLEWAKRFSWEDHAKGLVGQLRRSTVFGVEIDCETNADAVATVKAGGGKLVAFVNAHCLNIARSDDAYRTLLNDMFDKVWPDGTGIRMAGRKLGFAVPENINGTDLFPRLASEGLSFWFLGGKPGVAEEARRRCAAQFPQSRFIGVTDGFQDNWDAVLDEIEAARPDVLLVALGVPLQEKWIAAHRDRLRGVGCVMAVGGLLDFLSGRIPRAPLWMRRQGIEWIWRFAMEPRRMFRRYVIGNVTFLRAVARERSAK